MKFYINNIENASSWNKRGKAVLAKYGTMLKVVIKGLDKTQMIRITDIYAHEYDCEMYYLDGTFDYHTYIYPNQKEELENFLKDLQN